MSIYRSKKIAIGVLSSLLFCQPHAFCADSATELVKLDGQRNEILKQITSGLVSGKVTPTDAQQLKNELDGTVKLEARAQEDQTVTAAELSDISGALDQVRTHLATASHAKKVWVGIDSRDNTLEKNISDALVTRKISKEQADGLMQEAETLRAREANGSPTNEFEFTDAISLAGDIQTLAGKIDQLASASHVQ